MWMYTAAVIPIMTYELEAWRSKARLTNTKNNLLNVYLSEHNWHHGNMPNGSCGSKYHSSEYFNGECEHIYIGEPEKNATLIPF